MAQPFHIMKFYTKYTRDARTGKTRARDWVDICAIGAAQRQVTPYIVDALRPKVSLVGSAGEENPAYQMALQKWEVVSKAYEAWKAGQEMPSNGTPLAAWHGVTAEQADVLRMAGLKTVEDVAAATDSVISKVMLPNIRGLVESAKLFLSTADQAKVAEALKAKDAELALMREQMEELRQLVLAREAEPEVDEDGDPVPKRRGRPPKAAQPEAA